MSLKATIERYGYQCRELHDLKQLSGNCDLLRYQPDSLVFP
ncbi:hypothetical Protein YC6258_00575 [Gynuella sunshinyii YC6258]|uniref:Uncharacterized protein n=1 Tax=Gynuella sunshinyii YC6258 TaxID=1445510 RepID=A0A0C5UZ65_9GAMM|nr:hypothetical Protein YC6258_00575 [Gynuella sunshinyii YC6258]